MNFNPNFEAIGNAFVQHYYSKFDVTDPAVRTAGLSDLYDPDNSYMTFEGVQARGRDAILQRFGALTFRTIQRAITKTDCQPLPDGSILVAIIGQLKAGFGVCVLLQLVALYTMRSMAKCHRNEKGQVVDAGLDLNQPEAFGEYCKDVIILTSFVLFFALLWSPVFFLLLVIPGFAFYKLWTGLLAPWIFARAEEEEGEDDEKRYKKRERKLRKT